MKITIEGEPKEIADFVLRIQKRHEALSKDDIQELTNVTVKRALREKVRGSKF